MQEQGMFTGIGQVYFTTADDEELKNLRPITCKTNLDVTPNEEKESHWPKYESHVITGSLHLDNSQAKKLCKLMCDGRMPRKEKKRRKNRVLRDRKMLTRIAIALWNNDYYAWMMACNRMFPERFKIDEYINRVLILQPNESKVIRILVKYIEQNQEKIIRQNWDIVKEMKRKALWMMQADFISRMKKNNKED